MLGFAVVNLGIAPRDFWRMTLNEYAAAHKTWMRMQGFDENKAQNKMTRNDLADLAALVK